MVLRRGRRRTSVDSYPTESRPSPLLDRRGSQYPRPSVTPGGLEELSRSPGFRAREGARQPRMDSRALARRSAWIGDVPVFTSPSSSREEAESVSSLQRARQPPCRRLLRPWRCLESPGLAGPMVPSASQERDRDTVRKVAGGPRVVVPEPSLEVPGLAREDLGGRGDGQVVEVDDVVQHPP